MLADMLCDHAAAVKSWVQKEKNVHVSHRNFLDWTGLNAGGDSEVCANGTSGARSLCWS